LLPIASVAQFAAAQNCCCSSYTFTKTSCDLRLLFPSFMCRVLRCLCLSSLHFIKNTRCTHPLRTSCINLGGRAPANFCVPPPYPRKPYPPSASSLAERSLSCFSSLTSKTTCSHRGTAPAAQAS
jgi:hypothetical protein